MVVTEDPPMKETLPRETGPPKREVTNSHDDRPSSKTVLPFRAFRDGRGRLVIECYRKLDNGYQTPFQFFAEDHDYDPRGMAVFNLMQMFYAVEAERDGLASQRDELVSRVAVLEGDVRSVREQLEGLRAATKKAKG